MTKPSETISVLIDDKIVDNISLDKIKDHINIWEWTNLKKHSKYTKNSIHFSVEEDHLALVDKAGRDNETCIKPRRVYGSGRNHDETELEELLKLKPVKGKNINIPDLVYRMIPEEFKDAEIVKWRDFTRLYSYQRKKEKYIAIEDDIDSQITVVFINSKEYEKNDRYWLSPSCNKKEGKLNYITYDLKNKKFIKCSIDGNVFHHETDAIKYKAKVEIELHEKALQQNEKKNQEKEAFKKKSFSDKAWSKLSKKAQELLLSDKLDLKLLENTLGNNLHELEIPKFMTFEQIKPGEYREVSYNIINALADYLSKSSENTTKKFSASDEYILADHSQHIEVLKSELYDISFQNEKKKRKHISFEPSFINNAESIMHVEIGTLPKISIPVCCSKNFSREEFSKQIKLLKGLCKEAPEQFTFLTPEILTSPNFISVSVNGQLPNKATYDRSSIYLRNKEHKAMIQIWINDKFGEQALTEYLKIIESEPNISTKDLEQKFISSTYPEINKLLEKYEVYKNPNSFYLNSNNLIILDQDRNERFKCTINTLDLSRLESALVNLKIGIPTVFNEQLKNNEIKVVSSTEEILSETKPHSLIFDPKEKTMWLTDHNGKPAFQAHISSFEHGKHLLDLYKFVKKTTITSDSDYLLYFFGEKSNMLMPLAKLLKIVFEKNIKVTSHHKHNGKYNFIKPPKLEIVLDQSFVGLYLDGEIHRSHNITKPEYLNKFIDIITNEINEISEKVEVAPETIETAPLTTAAAVVSVGTSVISASVDTKIKEINNMAKNTIQEKAIQIIRSDAQETAKRVAVLRMSKVIQDGLVKALTQDLKGKNKNQTKKAFEEFFATEKGVATIQMVAGVALPYVQKYLPEKYHAYVDIVATEMRVQGGTTATLEVIGVVEPMIKLLAGGIMDSFNSMNFVSEFVRIETETVDAAKVPEQAQAEVVELSSAKNGKANGA